MFKGENDVLFIYLVHFIFYETRITGVAKTCPNKLIARSLQNCCSGRWLLELQEILASAIILYLMSKGHSEHYTYTYMPHKIYLHIPLEGSLCIVAATCTSLIHTCVRHDANLSYQQTSADGFLLLQYYARKAGSFLKKFIS